MNNFEELERFRLFRKVYTTEQEDAISQEFSRLKDDCYLDHAGSTLYSERQIQEVSTDLIETIYANPHARNLASKLTDDAIDIIRFELLNHFNTSYEEYSVIFTSGATGALKIVAECFNYGESGTLTYLQSNHTSVLGMREFANNTVEIKTEEAFNLLSADYINEYHNIESSCNNLFVYPAQCNFSGTKYPLSWIPNIKRGNLNALVKEISSNWYVVLDCASYVSTNTLDLSRNKPDFVPISFYKIFGYPTGLGALLVRKSSEQLLIKKYFGGGTILMVLSSENIVVPRTSLHQRFEDGTLPFLSILAIKHGFETIKRLKLNFDLISQHTFSLAQYVYRNLLLLHHFNEKPAVLLYHDTLFENVEEQGGIVNFNLLRPNGDYIGYSEVLHISNLNGIHLRTGCFCNPGACQRHLKLSSCDAIKQFEAGHVCGDQHDLVDNYPTGSVRISFGYMSTKNDADKFLNMIEANFVLNPIKNLLPHNWNNLRQKCTEYFHKANAIQIFDSKEENEFETLNIREYLTNNHNVNKLKTERAGTLQQILLYPIKSCGAFSVMDKWPITTRGFKYDREWMIVNSKGVSLTQKQSKKLCLIKPEIDLHKNVLRLSFRGESDFEISLIYPSHEIKPVYLCQSKICGDRIQGWECGKDISVWLSNNLGIPGLRLLRQCNENMLGRIPDNDTTPKLSLVNKAQYLLVNTASVDWLRQKIPYNELNEHTDSIVLRFRPNLVVKLEQPFEENNYDGFFIDNIMFKSAGNCTRCQMICINQLTGEVSKEPLLTLSREFNGKILFGIYLSHETTQQNTTLTVGSEVLGKK